MVVVEHVVGVVGAGAVASVWGWSWGGKGVPWRREGTVFLCMLPRVPVQQVSYTLAREGAYFPQGTGWGAPKVGVWCRLIGRPASPAPISRAFIDAKPHLTDISRSRHMAFCICFDLPHTYNQYYARKQALNPTSKSY